MNIQSRIDIKTRKSLRGHAETRLTKKVVSLESDRAFVPAELVSIKEQQKQAVMNKSAKSSTIEEQEKKRKLQLEQHIINKKQKKETVEKTSVKPLETETHLLSPPRQDSFEENENTCIEKSQAEPMTPPRNQPSEDSPLKTYVSTADRLRMEDEQKTLEKLQKVLDIILTDRFSRGVPALYSQIESPLRNSTRRTITLSHVLKVIYIAPKLYSLEAKEIRRFGNKTVEDYLIEFEKSWDLPLSPKDYASRKDLIHNGLKAYFETHTEYNATVPEASLPKLDTIIDKKEWIKEAKLPPGVKSLLEAHTKVKEEKIESQTPKPTPKGTAKERMAALRARLASKK